MASGKFENVSPPNKEIWYHTGLYRSVIVWNQFKGSENSTFL